MKVKDAIEQLKKYDEDAELFISIDEEGNQFKPLKKVGAWRWEGGDLVKHDAIVLWPFG